LAELLARLLPPRGIRRRERSTARPRERDGRGIPVAHAPRRPLRAAPCSRQRAHDGGRRTSRVGGAAAVRSGVGSTEPHKKAVIFDLWDTLALWPSEAFEDVKQELARHIDDFERVWDTTYDSRQAGSIDAYFRGLGLEDEAVEECVRLRSDFTRRALVPRDGAVETLEELRRCGFKRGLISVCSTDVEEAWDEIELAPHVDEVVLSCTVGLRKPDPAIYLLTCDRLG